MVTILVLLFIATGFFREYVFLNWNEQIRVAYYHATDSHVTPMMNWLTSFSYDALYWLKWPLTLFFSILFCFYAYLIIRISFNNRQYNRITVYAYIATFAISFLFFAIGWALNSRDATYDIARFLAGLIETPAMLLILAASFMVHRRL